MKIDHNVTFLRNVTGTATPVSARNGAHVRGVAPEKPVAASLAAAPLLPSTNGDFDAARVAEIRESISAGRYQINAEKIADGLLDTVRDLLGKKTP